MSQVYRVGTGYFVPGMSAWRAHKKKKRKEVESKNGTKHKLEEVYSVYWKKKYDCSFQTLEAKWSDKNLILMPKFKQNVS